MANWAQAGVEQRSVGMAYWYPSHCVHGRYKLISLATMESYEVSQMKISLTSLCCFVACPLLNHGSQTPGEVRQSCSIAFLVFLSLLAVGCQAEAYKSLPLSSPSFDFMCVPKTSESNALKTSVLKSLTCRMYFVISNWESEGEHASN